MDWPAFVIFIVISFGLAWLGSIPLWLDRGTAHPAFQLIAGCIMFTPTIATVIVITLVRRRRGAAAALGMTPLRPLRRLLAICGVCVIAFPLLSLAALALASAVGLIQFDLANLSGFRAALESQFAAAGANPDEVLNSMPIHAFAALQIGNILFNTIAASVLVLGEELGWRGWLLPQLRPLGTWPALLISGVIWGLWHSPLILLGYNYGRSDFSGVLLMIAFCVSLGTLLGWLRIRTGSVWPAVFAHAAINASTGVWVLVLLPAGATIDIATSTLLGWPGWLLMGAIAMALVIARQFRDPSPQSANHINARS